MNEIENTQINIILNYIKEYVKDTWRHDSEPMLNWKDLETLLDYITNLQTIEQQYSAILSENAELQEENKEYSMIFDTFSKRPYAHKYLEEKKKKLNNNKIIGLDSEMVYKDYYDYKSRCEKAIEYIMSDLITEWDIKNDGYVSGSDLPADAITPILNILKGSDEE